MYRLSIRNIFIFIGIVIVGAIVAAVTPKYFGGLRILSPVALLIGEAGMSFIPVIALYPKANPIQAVLLALVFFLTTFIICFSAWVINSLNFPDICAFIWKAEEFHINTHSLLVANMFSLVALALNFKLVYDEELTKEVHQKATKEPKRPKFSAPSFQKPLLKRPQFTQGTNKASKHSEREKYTKRTRLEDTFKDDFGKPFEFEPEIEFSSEELPEESSGKLFYKEDTEKLPPSEFFDTEEDIKEEKSKDITSSYYKRNIETIDTPFPEKPKPIQVSTQTPSDIKTDLALIFEQYSSLNAIKKLTSIKTTKAYQKQKEKEVERKTKKPYKLHKETQQISVHIEGQDFHDASFRQISEAEKLEEIKEEFKKELHEKIQEKTSQDTQKAEETIQSIKSIKEEIKKELHEKIQEKASQDAQKAEETIQSIKSIKEELKQELQDKIQERISQDTQKIEETLQKTTDTKDEIIESIKNIKEELMESLKEKLKKELLEEQIKEQVKILPEPKEITKTIQEEEITEENIKLLQERLTNLNKESKVIGSMFLSQEGKSIVENWGDKQILHKEVDNTIPQLFKSINNQINKTNQGNLCHLLLESENGILILAEEENKILTVYTEGTGELYSGQILRALTESE